jgi:hypothetical protein
VSVLRYACVFIYLDLSCFSAAVTAAASWQLGQFLEGRSTLGGVDSCPLSDVKYHRSALYCNSDERLSWAFKYCCCFLCVVVGMYLPVPTPLKQTDSQSWLWKPQVQDLISKADGMMLSYYILLVFTRRRVCVDRWPVSVFDHYVGEYNLKF